MGVGMNESDEQPDTLAIAELLPKVIQNPNLVRALV